MNDVPPKDRNLAMVFQNYALFPHMTVEKNLSFGMKVRHEPRESIGPRSPRSRAMLGIEPLLDRKPAELSGGERQRVALGRALLRKPQAFLLDEPLSNLDAALRTQMRTELQRIHRQFPVTTIYVTHDQVEAMTMADRVALMHQGQLQQVGTPQALYEEPPAPLWPVHRLPEDQPRPGRVRASGGRVAVAASDAIPLDGAWGIVARRHREVTIGIRPEDLRLDSDVPASCHAAAGDVDV